MVEYHMVRCTFAAVIIAIVYAQCISCAPAYIRHEVSRNTNDISDYADDSHKHLTVLKAPDPQFVEKVKRRIKLSMSGRKPDQSNERNLWTSHPKKEDWSGPDTDEVIGVNPSLGI